MFLQRKGQVIMTIELLDTEEAQTEDPVEVQVRPQRHALYLCTWRGQEQPWAASVRGSHPKSPVHQHRPQVLRGSPRWGGGFR